MGNILQWFAGIAAAFTKLSDIFSRAPPPISDIAAEQEIQRRRELIRLLFNDFWNGRDDKPATFADRLDQAEIYLNDRLTACGEYWQLDAKTRKLLGLPARRSTASA